MRAPRRTPAVRVGTHNLFFTILVALVTDRGLSALDLATLDTALPVRRARLRMCTKNEISTHDEHNEHNNWEKLVQEIFCWL